MKDDLPRNSRKDAKMKNATGVCGAQAVWFAWFREFRGWIILRVKNAARGHSCVNRQGLSLHFGGNCLTGNSRLLEFGQLQNPMHPPKIYCRVSLTASVVIVLLAGCKKAPDRLAWWQGEQQRTELAQRLELAKYRHQTSPQDRTPQLLEAKAQVKALDQHARALTQSRAVLTAEISQLERQLSQLAQESVKDQRFNAIGLKFQFLAIASGKTFEDVVVTNVDDVGVIIHHRDGLARLRCSELFAEQRDFFGLDEATAFAAEARELQQETEYDRLLDRSVAAIRKQEQIARAAADREEAIANNLSRALLLAQASTKERVSPLVASSTRQSSTGWSNRWDRSTRPRYRSVYYYPYVSCSRSQVPASRGNTGGSIKMTPKSHITLPIP